MDIYYHGQGILETMLLLTGQAAASWSCAMHVALLHMPMSKPVLALSKCSVRDFFSPDNKTYIFDSCNRNSPWVAFIAAELFITAAQHGHAEMVHLLRSKGAPLETACLAK